jgi:hypothetical protein
MCKAETEMRQFFYGKAIDHSGPSGEITKNSKMLLGGSKGVYQKEKGKAIMTDHSMNIRRSNG